MRKFVIPGIVLVLSVSGAACGGDDDAGGGGSGSGFCDLARELGEAEVEDVSDEEALAALRDIRDEAPDELRDDLDTLVDFSERALEVGDDPEAIAELLEDSTELDEASTNLTTYLSEECGIDSE